MKNKLILDTIGLILIIAIFCILVCCVSVPFQPTIPEQGDVNADGCINNHDVYYMVDWFYKSGPPAIYPITGDLDRDCKLTINDLAYLNEYVNRCGPKPQPHSIEDCPNWR